MTKAKAKAKPPPVTTEFETAAAVEAATEINAPVPAAETDAEARDRIERLPRESRKLLFERHLQQPFHAKEVKWKPQSVKGNRCLAIAYIDARLVMDRLDDVCGVDGWTDAYTILADGSCMCRLTVRTPYGIEVTKSDVGSPSEQPDAGDRLKASVSDALKRAAVKFGIGRYLYRLPMTWVDYDPVKKRITAVPKLPDWALPVGNVPEPRPYYEPDATDDA